MYLLLRSNGAHSICLRQTIKQRPIGSQQPCSRFLAYISPFCACASPWQPHRFYAAFSLPAHDRSQLRENHPTPSTHRVKKTLSISSRSEAAKFFVRWNQWHWTGWRIAVKRQIQWQAEARHPLFRPILGVDLVHANTCPVEGMKVNYAHQHGYARTAQNTRPKWQGQVAEMSVSQTPIGPNMLVVLCYQASLVKEKRILRNTSVKKK